MGDSGADPRFREGLRLFNAGDYFECHEVIEALWLETPAEDPARDLYKGVIQAAVALHHRERGNRSGALGLLKSSMVYLKKYTPASQGLNTAKLVREMERFFAEGTKASREGKRPGEPTVPQADYE